MKTTPCQYLIGVWRGVAGGGEPQGPLALNEVKASYIYKGAPLRFLAPSGPPPLLNPD